MEECRNFAESLEAIRKVRKMTMSGFSRELHVPKSTLQNVLRNGSTSLHTALHIAGQLNVPLSTLTGEANATQNFGTLSSLLECLEWFADLPGEDQRKVTSHLHAIVEVLQK